MTTDKTIPKIDNHGEVPIDVDTLILSKLLVSANSGGGKSRLLRRIAEQTWGHAQHLIFDAEGDFHTLREKFPYLLFGPGGDAPLTVEIAGKLILRLLEVGSSAILDLSDLPVLDAKDGGDQRAVFIQRALHAAMQAPRELWHPSEWFIDEIHLWAPENGFGTAVSTATVCDFFTRGRKRGWGGIAATQRLAAVHKSVAAECNNRLIGRTGLDVDQTRAAKNLGMKASTDTFRMLANLEPGEFFAFGPALSKEVVRVRSGTVTTTHPTAGHRASAPTPAPAKVQKMLAQFRDLPKEVAKEENELEHLRARVRTLEADKSGLEADLENRPTVQSKRDEVQSVLDKARAEIKELHTVIETQSVRINELTKDLALRDEIEDDLVQELRLISERATNASNIVVNRLEDAIEREASNTPNRIPDEVILATRERLRASPHGGSMSETIVATLPTTSERVVEATYNGTGDPTLSNMERTFLTVLAQSAARSEAPTKRLMLLYAGYLQSGNTAKAFGRLTREGWMVENDGGWSITAKGSAALGSFEPLKRGADLRKQIASKLDAMTSKIFETVCEAYPKDIAKGELLKRCGYQQSGNTAKAFGWLVKTGHFTQPRKAVVQAAKELFAS